MRGVASITGADDPAAVTRHLARAHGLVAAMTGERDIISDGERVVEVANGHLWLTRVSGTGCMATAVLAALAAVESDTLVAAVAGLTAYGVAAELAAAEARGPASFKIAFLDQLYNLTEDEVLQGARITIH